MQFVFKEIKRIFKSQYAQFRPSQTSIGPLEISFQCLSGH